MKNKQSDIGSVIEKMHMSVVTLTDSEIKLGIKKLSELYAALTGLGLAYEQTRLMCILDLNKLNDWAEARGIV